MDNTNHKTDALGELQRVLDWHQRQADAARNQVAMHETKVAQLRHVMDALTDKATGHIKHRNVDVPPVKQQLATSGSAKAALKVREYLKAEDRYMTSAELCDLLNTDLDLGFKHKITTGNFGGAIGGRLASDPTIHVEDVRAHGLGIKYLYGLSTEDWQYRSAAMVTMAIKRIIKQRDSAALLATANGNSND